MANSQHGTSVLFTSHPKDGLVVNLYIPHNRRTPLQAEEAHGPISIPRGSRGVVKVWGLVCYVVVYSFRYFLLPNISSDFGKTVFVHISLSTMQIQLYSI